jgi:quercetin dioxygenase-like cupin family protein
MSRVRLDDDGDHLVTAKHSDVRGPVVRGQSLELIKMHWRKGETARPHRHGEEQFIYLISGRMRFTVDGESYEIGAGEASYHPANALHSTECLEDTIAISFKDIVAPFYEATKKL